MAGVLFWANGKRAQGRKTNKNQFTNKICYQTNKISSDQLVLDGWSVEKISEAAAMLSGKVHSGTLVISAQVAGMAEHMLHMWYYWPHLNSAMAGGTQEAESCRRREKYNLGVLKKHPTEWEKRMRKSCPQVTYEKRKIACSRGWLRVERKD